jgi:hypothetical protein
MAYQSLGIGSSLNDGTGDTLRSGGSKINDNFSEIYTLMGDGESLSSGISSSATVITLTAPTISGAVGGTQTSATITTLTTTTVNGTLLNAGTLALGAASITDTSGTISFGNDNITTTGTLTSGNLTCGTITSTGASIVFEGATADAHETTITVTDPTADRTITVPNETGTLLTTGTSDTVDSTMLKSASTLLIVNSSGSTLKTVIGAGS